MKIGDRVALTEEVGGFPAGTEATVDEAFEPPERSLEDGRRLDFILRFDEPVPDPLSSVRVSGVLVGAYQIKPTD